MMYKSTLCVAKVYGQNTFNSDPPAANNVVKKPHRRCIKEVRGVAPCPCIQPGKLRYDDRLSFHPADPYLDCVTTCGGFETGR